MTQEQQVFIDKVAPAAQEAARRYGVWPSVCIAQAILESGWGRSELARDHLNLWGVKWQGNQIGPFPEHVKGITLHRTTERPTGRPEYTIDAWFRTYATVTDSALDYANNLRSKKVYADTGCWEAKTADEFAIRIGPVYTGGDNSYSAKVLDIVQRYNLRRFDTTPKETAVAKATYYPPADRNAQNFYAKYPGGQMTPNVLLLHTTEGSSWPDYQAGASTPHFTMRFDGGRVQIRQHLPVDRSARALADKAGGVATNRLNVVQVELVGTSGWASAENPKRPYTIGLKAQDFPDYALKAIADLWVWLHREWGVPLSITPRGFVKWNAKRPTMTNAEWNNFRGLCGHQHVPENDHSDPGAINAPRILELARQIVSPAAKPAPAPEPAVNNSTPTPGASMTHHYNECHVNADGVNYARAMPEIFSPQGASVDYQTTCYIDGSAGTTITARLVEYRHPSGFHRHPEVTFHAKPGQPTVGQLVHNGRTYQGGVQVWVDIKTDLPDPVMVRAYTHTTPAPTS